MTDKKTQMEFSQEIEEDLRKTISICSLATILFIIGIALIVLLSNMNFGTSVSAYNDGEKNVECWDVRVNDENILGTYHYERKCVLYTGDQTEPEEDMKR